MPEKDRQNKYHLLFKRIFPICYQAGKDFFLEIHQADQKCLKWNKGTLKKWHIALRLSGIT